MKPRPGTCPPLRRTYFFPPPMTVKILPLLTILLLPAALALAAPAGDAEALFQQARTALHAEGGPADPGQVFALMKKAAEQGHADAEAGLGYL